MNWAPSVSLADLAEGGLFTDGDWVESKDQDPAGSVRLTQLADVGVGEFRDRSDRWLRPDQAAALKCTFIAAQDVLIARMPDPIGRACLAPATLGNAVTAVDVSILRIRREDADPRYVMWAINSPRFHSEVEAKQSGTTRKRISRKNLGSLTVPLPPIEEQRRIVDLLEDHLSRLEAADAYLEATLRRLEALELSMLGEVRRELGRGVTRRIDELAETALGKMLDAKRQTGTAHNYLRNVNVRWGHFDLSDVQTTLLTPEDVERFSVRDGDVFVCEGGEPGRCAVWRGEAQGLAYQKALHRLRVRDRDQLSEDFLALMLTEAIRSGRHDHLFTGTTIKHLPQEKLRRIAIPVPSLEQQRALLRKVDDLRRGSQRMRGDAEAVQSRAASLRRSLLAAAFSGQLTDSSRLSAVEEMIDA